MDILGIILLAAGVLSALTALGYRPPRHRRGLPLAQLQARLDAEAARTYLPVRGW